MSEQGKFTYHEGSEPVRPSEALSYEATELHDYHTMSHETNNTSEQRLAPGEWEQPFVEAATAQLVYYRLVKLAESGNEEARQALTQGMPVASQQLTRHDVDLAA